MTDEEKAVNAKLHATLGALEGVVAQYGGECVGTAIQALCMKDIEVLKALRRAATIVMEDLFKDQFKQLAETCQCAECRAQRAQA